MVITMPTSKLTNVNATTTLKVVVYGQGSTENRGPTLLRLSDSLREELAEVAQGQLYMLVEIALRKYIDELKARPSGQIEVIDASTLQAPPAKTALAKRQPRRKPKPDGPAVKRAKKSADALVVANAKAEQPPK